MFLTGDFRVLTRTLFPALAVFLGVVSVRAQPPKAPEAGGPPAYAPSLTFDVVSIRETEQPDDAWAMGLNSQPHMCNFDAKGITPRVLLGAAYGFGTYQLAGAPEWVESTFWVVEARCDHSVDARLAKLTDAQARLEKQHMMQALLADRFHLKAHWESKAASIQAMVLAKSGSKLEATKIATPEAGPDAATPETKGADIKNVEDAHGHVMTVTNISPLGIAALLSGMLHVSVADRTGLTGRYDFTLKYTYQSSDPGSYPTVSTAIQEQLGLKLESTRGPVDVLVIDHIERPTAN